MMQLRSMFLGDKTNQNSAGFNVIVDSGASIPVTPCRKDFKGDLKAPPKDLTLKGISSGLPVQGIGILTWYFVDNMGIIQKIETEGLYVPEMTTRLFSPQSYMRKNNNDRSYYMDRHDSKFTFKDGHAMALEYHERSMLPLARGFHEHEVSNIAEEIHMCVNEDGNQNLTAHQKQLLKWHFRLGHTGFDHVKWLARKGFIPNGISACDSPKCASCQFGAAQRRTVGRHSVYDYPKTLGGSGHIKTGDLKPGDRLSVDQYESRVRGRLKTSRGKTVEHEMICGGTIFCDHASHLIDVRHQLTFGATDTIRSKRMFERMALSNGVLPKTYHSDNGVFTATQFRQHLEEFNQGLSLSGVGAHHQNGVAERAIRTVMNRARILMLHASMRWPEEADSSLWPFALSYAAHLWNTTPRASCGGLSPMEIFTSTKDEYSQINHAHVWRCPAYVLDRSLQDGKKIPKWRPRSRRGMFVGISPEHASTIGEILNLTTGSISSQYHVVYDDWFSTVYSPDDVEPPA
ncbi:MAG: hypothetical protein ACREBR_01535, partial [bacterium]